MKIVHVVSSLDPAAGGPPQVAIRLASAHAALGHDVHLVYYATTGDGERVQQQVRHVPNQERVVRHPIGDPGRLERLRATRARAVMGELLGDTGFVHVHGVWGSILRVAASAARRAAVPYCVRPAGMLDPWSLAQKRWKKRFALAAGYRSMLAGAAFIHVLNEDELHLIEPLRLGVPAVVLPNGVFVEELDPLPERGSFRAEHPELGSSPFILFLSRLHAKKGLDILAEAFIRLARRREGVHLVVAGPDEGAGPELRRRIAGAELGDRVHLVGPLYGRDKLSAFVDAACFCLPSRQEGFSVAITEAMACGVAVVISEGCHFPEVAEVGAGLIVPLAPEPLAEALERVLADPTTAGRMGKSGAALVRSRYTWNAVAEQCIAAYAGARTQEA